MGSSTSEIPVAPWIARIIVWGVLFAVLLALRSFFLLIFLTFAFAFIQAQAVNRFERYIPHRLVRVWLVGITFLFFLLAVAGYMAPSIKEQGVIFAANYPSHIKGLDAAFSDIFTKYPAVKGMIPSLHDLPAGESGREWSLDSSITATIVKTLLGEEQRGIGTIVEYIQNIGGTIFRVLSAFFLALLFSFLIVLDLPSLAEGIRGLRRTRLRFVYEEVFPSISRFGIVVGQALEAQFFIALLNTILTGLGLTILGLSENMAFLLLIVFLCGFIPIAGMFISSFPICLLALQTDGVVGMVLVALLIVVIHMVEAYILNPRIFGHHLKINPVLALMILTLGGKLFGVWGFVLGLPVCTYIFKYAIREEAHLSEKA